MSKLLSAASESQFEALPTIYTRLTVNFKQWSKNVLCELNSSSRHELFPVVSDLLLGQASFPAYTGLCGICFANFCTENTIVVNVVLSVEFAAFNLSGSLGFYFSILLELLLTKCGAAGLDHS